MFVNNDYKKDYLKYYEKEIKAINCIYCNSDPHKRGCPCYDEDDEIIKANKCSYCGESDVTDGVKIYGEFICKDCLSELDVEELLDLLGYDSVSELIEAFNDI